MIHVVFVSLSNAHVLYNIRLGFERRLTIYVGLSVRLSVRLSARLSAWLSVCSSLNRNYTFIKNHTLAYFTSNERARQLLRMYVFIFLIQILKKVLLLYEFHLYNIVYT